MELKVTVTKKENSVFEVFAVGAIESTTYDILDKELMRIVDLSARALVLNMEGVNYISSMGISVIVKAKKAMESIGSLFIITNLQPQVAKVFEIIKALPGPGIFSSIEEVDAYLSQIQRKELEKGKKEI